MKTTKPERGKRYQVYLKPSLAAKLRAMGLNSLSRGISVMAGESSVTQSPNAARSAASVRRSARQADVFMRRSRYRRSGRSEYRAFRSDSIRSDGHSQAPGQ